MNDGQSLNDDKDITDMSDQELWDHAAYLIANDPLFENRTQERMFRVLYMLRNEARELEEL